MAYSMRFRALAAGQYAIRGAVRWGCTGGTTYRMKLGSPYERRMARSSLSESSSFFGHSSLSQR